MVSSSGWNLQPNNTASLSSALAEMLNSVLYKILPETCQSKSVKFCVKSHIFNVTTHKYYISINKTIMYLYKVQVQNVYYI